MYIRRNFVGIVLVSALTILGQGIGEAEAAGASYSDLQPDAFMKSWLLLGPIPVFPEESESQEMELQKKAFATDFLEKQGGEAGVAPKIDMVQQIGEKELKWQLFESSDDIVDLIKVYGEKEYVIAYAWAEINSPEEKDVLLGIGSDDGVKVWINGKLIHENWVGRAANKDDDLVPAKLQKGKNQILLKVQNMQIGWGFAFRVLGKMAFAEKFTSAAGRGNLDDMEMLLSHGADIDATNEIGLTALHKAQMSGREDAINLLLENGADPNIKMPDKGMLAAAIFNRVIKGNSPGASVLVAKDGEIIYQNGFGYADIGNRVPFTVDTKSRIGSVTKQFTASAILKLKEKGELSIDDRLSKYVPDFPRGEEVTIHHLLTHTSGIHSYTEKEDFLKTVTLGVEPEEHIKSFKNDKFDFDPGEKWLYSNSGYFLLSYIVEKVSGQSFNDYLKSEFFDSLGMKNTGVHNPRLILENEATGYSYENGKFQKALDWDMSRAKGAGALYSTVGDLFLWNEGIFNGKALDESSLEAAFTPVTLNDGKKAEAFGTGYGYGWMVNEKGRLKAIQHSGGLHGFNSMLIYYPEIKATVAVLQNCLPMMPGMGAGELAGQISEVFFWEQMKPQESYKVDETVSSDKYDDYVGKYDYSGAIMTVMRDGDRLFAQLATQPRFEIFPRAEDEFFWKVTDAQITFVRDEKGEVTHAVHHQGGNELKAPRVKEEAPTDVDPAVYDQYVGEYNFPQLDITVTKEEDKLFAQAAGQPKIELLPRSESEFYSNLVVLKIRFIKDDQGKVVKMIINQSGMELEGIKKN